MRYLCLILLSACDANDPGGASRDMAIPPLSCDHFGVGSACGMACADDSQCGAELHCNAFGKCEAECLNGDTRCGSAALCAPHGYCMAIGDDANSCPSVNLELTPLIPTVMLLIDQSGSMTTTDFMQGSMSISRWDAIKNALTANPGGVLPTLDQKVKFGADLYTGETGTCPRLTKLFPPALGQSAAIKMLMDNNPPADNTPTGESINALVADLVTLPKPDPSRDGPMVIALATDGDPDTCAAPDSNGTDPPKQVSIKAAQDAFSAGFPMYILGVSSDINPAHLQDMANAGAGLPIGGAMNAPFYTAHSPMDMVNAFNTIIKGVRSCTFNLNGQVDLAQAGTGVVILDGMMLGYMDANGWSLSDASTMVLAGSACDTFKQEDSVTLTATFPCGTVVK
jgi:hypothetical protein